MSVSMAPARSAMRYQLDTGLAGMTPAERAARGKKARAAVPRGSHAVFDPPSDRPDPIALLEEQATSHVPELVPVRRGRMMVSPFTYFRGAALPMAIGDTISRDSGDDYLCFHRFGTDGCHRADAAGNVQPDVQPWNRVGYGNNAIEISYVDVR